MRTKNWIRAMRMTTAVCNAARLHSASSCTTAEALDFPRLLAATLRDVIYFEFKTARALDEEH
jgi:hypothetical protein